MGYIVGLLGCWILADGFASLWAYSYGKRAENQSWLKDHSLRILRMLIGIALMVMGYSY